MGAIKYFMGLKHDFIKIILIRILCSLKLEGSLQGISPYGFLGKTAVA
jgi:hypothetical protein